MKRPDLREVPLSSALQHGAVITVSEGQWDAPHQAFYDGGCTVLELDENERPIRAFRKEVPS